MAVLIAAASLLLIAVVLLQTAFFHINPIKFGFHRFDFGRYVILAKSPTLGSDYDTISEVMSRNEASVGLRYKSKVQIILFERQSDIGRYQPFLSAVDKRNAVSVAPWPNTIYITPSLKEKYGTIQGSVGHELNHVLLIQNYGIIKTTFLWKRAEWIPEGFATYLNNWPYYFPKTQLLEKMKEAGIDSVSTGFPGTSQLKRVPLPLRYMIYRYFVEYLYQRKPSATVVQFLREAGNSPWKTANSFESALGDSLDNYWKAFWMNMIAK